MERVRRLVWNLSSYSNSRIVEVAKGFVDTSKESPALAGECHKTYLDCLVGAFSAREARRCLALLYICNEIVTMAPDDESWRTMLSGAMLKYVPLVCELALRQREYNVVLNVMQLPAVWKGQGLFDAEACDEMTALCHIHHRFHPTPHPHYTPCTAHPANAARQTHTPFPTLHMLHPGAKCIPRARSSWSLTLRHSP